MLSAYKTPEEQKDDDEIAAEARLHDRDAAPSKRGTLDEFLKQKDRPTAPKKARKSSDYDNNSDDLSA